MEGTRRGRVSARKIFERGARSGQRSARLDSEGQKVWQGRVQDTNEMLERKEKEHEEEEEKERERERERNTTREEVEKMRTKGKWMNAELSERHRQARKKNPDTTRVSEVYDRDNSRGVRECKRKKNDGEI
jgi:hypothetical protein